ncbi:DUF4398 domain-containing protein [Stutzerimonas stutzeri]|nr:DUF4398 domain-containing protein [Stutzerimonas stutzeri]HCL17107.1 DUF4398 domain-containing protein [Pseudomonas sp.]MBK3851813.1 DUF4398 domain-containing protein [Stutzerimonas stutzeri]OPG82879.1 DUF4398 domain-containing protein [Stutzerimonas stutzeri]RFF63200.1 DUF4398 domain-containing protein [Stutzerimonas stutzeri]
MLKRLFPSASLAFFMLAGCASDPAPTAQLQLSEQAVAQARSMEASRAHEELALAESKLGAARAALQAGDNRQARMLAEQAELDARLAEARVLKDQRQAQIDDLNRRIQRLRQQLGEVR